MNRASSQKLSLVALLCAGLVLPLPASAQAGSPLSNAAAKPSHTSSLPPVPTLIPLPQTKSPIAFFRELLAMNGVERRQALTNRPPESQARILAKVHEYQQLEPNQRELRLQVTELQWYLVPLMRAPATNRAAQLAEIPPRQRNLVEDRLREWDKLTSSVQQELLENEATLRYLTEISGLTDAQRRQLVQTISPTRRALLEQGIAHWDTMSAEQRTRTLSRFNQFFELTPDEKIKALNMLSGPERRQIEQTLKAFSSLPAEQRTTAIRSFAKFASLSLAERQQFLKNAERWKAMSPAERQAWRDLVRNIPPPLPPELPPMPPSTPPPRPARTIATNGN